MLPFLSPILSPPAALASALTFQDSFNRADESLEANANWTRLDGPAGVLTIRSNQVASTINLTGMYVSPDLGATDHYAEVTLSTANTGFTGFLAVRVTNSQNFIGVRQASGRLNSFRVVNNVFNNIGDVDILNAAGDKLRIAAQGNTLTIYLNGVVVGTRAIAADLPVTTRAGLLGRQIGKNPWIDDYKAGVL